MTRKRRIAIAGAVGALALSGVLLYLFLPEPIQPGPTLKNFQRLRIFWNGPDGIIEIRFITYRSEEIAVLGFCHPMDGDSITLTSRAESLLEIARRHFLERLSWCPF